MSAELSFVPTRDDAALSELRNDCDKLRAETERIREEISRLPPLPAAGEREEGSLVTQALTEEQLKVELDLWRERKPTVFCKSPAVVEADLHQQIQSSTHQLKELLLIVKEEKAELIKQQQKEEKALSDMLKIKETLTEHLKASSSERDGLSHADVLREKLQLKSSQRQLLTTQLVGYNLKHFCISLDSNTVLPYKEKFINDHLPQHDEGNKTCLRQKTTAGHHRQMKVGEVVSNDAGPHYLSLMDTITLLIDRTLSHSSQTPYISSETIWPPHFQLLLRSGVVQRHSEDPSLIRITPFHH